MHPLGRDYRCPGIWHNKNHSHAYRLKYIKTIDVWNQSSWCLEIQNLSLRFGLRPLSNLQVAPEFFPEDTESSEHRTSVLAVLQDVCSVGFLSLNKPQGKTYRRSGHLYLNITSTNSLKPTEVEKCSFIILLIQRKLKSSQNRNLHSENW